MLPCIHCINLVDNAIDLYEIIILHVKTNMVKSVISHFDWAIPHLFERLFLISWEKVVTIIMTLSLKTMEVQIKEDLREIRGLEQCRFIPLT